MSREGWTEVPAPAPSARAGWTEMPAASPALGGPSELEALGRGGLQGATLGFGDELAGYGTAEMQALTNLLPKALRAKLDLVEAPASDAYRYSRDLERERNDAAQKAHGGHYLGGNLAGGLFMPGGAALSGAKGLSALVKTGAALGAGAGLGSSDVDLTRDMTAKDAGRLAIDVGGNAVLGGAGGAVVRGVTQLPRALKSAGINIGKLVLPGASPEAVEQAIKGGAIRWGGTAGGAAERLGTTRDVAGRELGGVISGLEEGGARPSAQRLTQALQSRGASAPKTMNPTVANSYTRATARLQKAMGEEPLTLSGMEELKRSLQEGIPYGKPGAKESVRTQKDIASLFANESEQAVQDAAAQNPQLADLAAQFVPAKQASGLAIEGAKAALKGAKPGLYSRLLDITAPFSAAAAGYAHHGPKGALAALPAWAIEHTLRTRGPSTLARGAYGAGRALEGIGNLRPFSFESQLGNRLAPIEAVNMDPRTRALLEGFAP